MRDNDVLDDDEMDEAVRALVPASSTSRAWERSQREQLLGFITSSTAARLAPSEHGAYDVDLEQAGAERRGMAVGGRSRRWMLVGTAAAVALTAVLAVVARQRDSESASARQTTVPSSSVSSPDGYSLVQAKVLPSGFPGEEDRVRIDRGSRDGVAVGMPVVGGSGLVGKIWSVTVDESIVLLINSEQYSTPASVVVSGSDGASVTHVAGTIVGQGPGHPIVMRVADGSQPVEAVREQDAVVADRDLLDLAQPKVPIGTISRIERSADGSDTPRFEVDPHADLAQLDELRVLMVNRRAPEGS